MLIPCTWDSSRVFTLTLKPLSSPISSLHLVLLGNLGQSAMFEQVSVTTGRSWLQLPGSGSIFSGNPGTHRKLLVSRTLQRLEC